MDIARARDVLGVSRESSSEEIKRAFRRMAKETHPDRLGTDEAFRVVREAYETLTEGERSGFRETARGQGQDEGERAGGGSGKIELGAPLFVRYMEIDGAPYPFDATARILVVEEELLVGVDLMLPWPGSSGRVEILVSETESNPLVSKWTREVLQRSFDENDQLTNFWFSPFPRRMRIDGTPMDVPKPPPETRFTPKSRGRW